MFVKDIDWPLLPKNGLALGLTVDEELGVTVQKIKSAESLKLYLVVTAIVFCKFCATGSHELDDVIILNRSLFL